MVGCCEHDCHRLINVCPSRTAATPSVPRVGVPWATTPHRVGVMGLDEACLLCLAVLLALVFGVVLLAVKMSNRKS